MKQDKIIDLTHEISWDILSYPNDPPVNLKSLMTHNENGYHVTYVEFSSHVGTHVDFPFHFFDNLLTSSDYNIEFLIGRAIIIEVKSEKSMEIKLNKDIFKNIENFDYVIFNTGWSKFWGTEEYFLYSPYFSFELSNFLSNIKNLRGIGIDAPSVDKYDSSNYESHKALLSKNKIIIENLCNIDKINMDEFYLGCFPLKIKNADASPARVVAFFNKIL